MSRKLEEIKNSRLEFKHLAVIWFIVLPLISATIMILTLYFGYWYLLLTYILYIHFDPRSRIGTTSPNLRRDNFLFDIIKEYFDMKIIKTCDIPATKNYIFCYHPHGVVPTAFYAGLNSNCCGFDDLFPGIKLNIKCHGFNLVIPIMREFCLYFGGQPVSKESILSTLSKPGNSVLLNIGGGAEMIYAVPNTAKLIIKNRFGFIKIALETGSDLVPIYVFGENEVFNQSLVDVNSRNFWLRRKFYKNTNFFLPSISGRGILPNTKGIFPNNVPVRVVVGKPIYVEKTSNPSEEQIRELHAKYCKELEDLYNDHKDEFWYDSNSSPPKLEFLENPLR